MSNMTIKDWLKQTRWPWKNSSSAKHPYPWIRSPKRLPKQRSPDHHRLIVEWAMVIAAISSSGATLYVAYYASQQYEMSRKALTADSRNKSFATFVESVNVLCRFTEGLNVTSEEVLADKDNTIRLRVMNGWASLADARRDLDTWLDAEERTHITTTVTQLGGLFDPYMVPREARPSSQRYTQPALHAYMTELACGMVTRDSQNWFSTGTPPRKLARPLSIDSLGLRKPLPQN